LDLPGFFPFLAGNPFNQIAPRPQNSDLFLMVTVRGLVVWIPRIPENEGRDFFGFLGGIPIRIPNHQAPNHQLTITVVESLCCLAFFSEWFFTPNKTPSQKMFNVDLL